MKKAVGILLTNTGTPDSPAVSDVKRYLKALLSDPRVVRIPKLIWQPLLQTLILPRRALYSAKLYRNIWTAQGSPIRHIMLKLSVALEKHLNEQLSYPIYIETGMHYGNPSIEKGLAKLKSKNIHHLIVLPLFPQYSTTTTESARDQVRHILKNFPDLTVDFITQYAEYPEYLSTLGQHIQTHHRQGYHLVFSFHGLPQRFANQGDPYPQQCQQTAESLAEQLQLSKTSWTLTYQSRFGYAQWLKPYTFETLRNLAEQRIHQLSVVCPGFSIDCLETLEEIQIRGKEIFLKHGGKVFNYIPALNAQFEHAQVLAEVVKNHLSVHTSSQHS